MSFAKTGPISPAYFCEPVERDLILLLKLTPSFGTNFTNTRSHTPEFDLDSLKNEGWHTRRSWSTVGIGITLVARVAVAIAIHTVSVVATSNIRTRIFNGSKKKECN